MTPPTTDRSDIGTRLAQIRGSQTVDGLAEQVGSTAAALRAVERGDRLPATDLILALCRVLAVCPRWLLIGIGEPYLPADPPAAPQADEARLLRPATVTAATYEPGMFRDLTPEELK